MLAERSHNGPSTTPAEGAPGATASSQATAPPKIAIRGRNLLALVIAPEAPLDAWFAAFDAQLREAPGFFAGRPVVADLAAAQDAPLDALGRLTARDLKLVGAEGIDARRLAGTPWAGLPTVLRGREAPLQVRRDEPTPAPAARAPAPALRSLILDRSVRSGQSIIFEDGDVTVIGAIASGAEVIAGGSIHVYGALRGRAIAGFCAGAVSRIFCRRLEAELIAVAGVYRTAENWGEHLHARAAQIRCERGRLKFTTLE
jgi:septum site-determining protein MinC